MAEFTIRTDGPVSAIDITDHVTNAVSAETSDTVTVFVRHTTAGVTVNEAESRLLDDFERALTTLVADDGWRHDELDDNADAHIRAMIVGPSVTVPIVDGTLDLGTWQSVLLIECDGPRTRTIHVV